MENITLGGKTREVTDEQLEAIEKLLAPEQPKLRHGDYCSCNYGNRLVIQRVEGMISYDPTGVINNWPLGGNPITGYDVLGNIFTDLEQYATDATDVRTTCKHVGNGDFARVSIGSNGRINLGSGYLCPDCAIKHAHAIIQVALTAKRKQK